MGGRITEIAVAERGRLGTVVYIAAATGGLWRSTNAGVSWTSLFDSVRAPSIGAIAVAPSNPDVIWVGTGEPQNMRSSSWGNGVVQVDRRRSHVVSTDAGEIAAHRPHRDRPARPERGVRRRRRSALGGRW